MHTGSWNRHNPGRSGYRLVSDTEAVSHVGCPVQEKGHRCSFLSHAGHFLMPQFIAIIFQVTALRLHVGDLAHSSRNWVTGQARGVSAYLSPGSSRAQSLGYRLLQSGVSTRLLRVTREACQRLLAQLSMADGQGAGVGLARSIWLKGQPVERAEVRMPGPRGTWAVSVAWVSVSGHQLPSAAGGQHLHSEVWPGAGHTRPG